LDILKRIELSIHSLEVVGQSLSHFVCGINRPTMKKYLFVKLLLLAFLLNNCSEKIASGENISLACDIDTILLATQTTDHLPYTPLDSTLIFTNNAREEKVFRMRYYTEGMSQLGLNGVFCTVGQQAMRHSNTRKIWYESADSLLLFVNHYLYYLVDEPWTYQRFVEADPYEIFLISMQSLAPENYAAERNSCVLRRVVNDFGSVDVQREKSQLEQVRFSPDMQIGDTTLTDVYEPGDCQGQAPLFYYRPEDGIVAFVDTAGVTWLAQQTP